MMIGPGGGSECYCQNCGECLGQPGGKDAAMTLEEFVEYLGGARNRMKQICQPLFLHLLNQISYDGLWNRIWQCHPEVMMSVYGRIGTITLLYAFAFGFQLLTRYVVCH